MLRHCGWLARLALGALLLAATGCSLTTPTSTAYLKPGPAFGQPPGRVLALPTVCLAKDEDMCHEGIEQAVAAQARMLLEFVGYRLIDGEMANIYTSPPSVDDNPRADEGPDVNRQTVEVDESGRIQWNEAAVGKHNALLLRAGVDSYLESRIIINQMSNMSGKRHIEVVMTLVRLNDLGLVWRSRCSVQSGAFYTLDQAMQKAARCAVEAATRMES